MAPVAERPGFAGCSSTRLSARAVKSAQRKKNSWCVCVCARSGVYGWGGCVSEASLRLVESPLHNEPRRAQTEASDQNEKRPLFMTCTR